MMGILKDLRATLKWTLILALAWASLFIAKNVETRFFPVVEDVEITEVVPAQAKGEIYVYLRFKKTRSCEFVKVIWYNRHGEVVPVRFKDEVGTRPPSNNEVGPWTVHMDAIEGSTLYVQHQCHPLWSQFTQMYP